MTKHIETRVIDNFLDEEDYILMRKVFLNEWSEEELLAPDFKTIAWRTSQIVYKSHWNEDLDPTDNIQMVAPLSGGINNEVVSLEPFAKKINPLVFTRIKANITFRGLKINEHGLHCDISPKNPSVLAENDQLSHVPMATGVYYLNTCDGYTLFEDGTKVPSVGNRFIEFDRTLKHTGTNTTDTALRSVINFNYIPKPRFTGAGEDVFRFPCDPLADLGYDPSDNVFS